MHLLVFKAHPQDGEDLWETQSDRGTDDGMRVTIDGPPCHLAACKLGDEGGRLQGGIKDPFGIDSSFKTVRRFCL